MNDDEKHKLNAIVGAAVKALAESGAEDAVIGAFADSHRSKVAQILGHSANHEPAPDLLQLVTQAVSIAIANTGLMKQKRKKRQAKRRVAVVVFGKRTTLTLSGESLDKLAKVTGGVRQASAAIQALAASVPIEETNRSQWVEQRLIGLIASQSPETSEARH